MTRPGIAPIAALALAMAILFGGPGASMAAPHSRRHVHPGVSIASFTADGTNGWQLSVSTFARYRGKVDDSIGLYARGPHHESVLYDGTKAKVTEDGDIVAKLPGLGRIAVEFDQTSEKSLRFIPEEGCKADGETVVRKGFVRGTIQFHGEGGYTTIARRSAPGEIIETPKEVCQRPKFTPAPGHIRGEEEQEEQIDYFLAGRDIGKGRLTFSALSTGAPFPTADYSASYSHHRHGLFILATTVVDGRKAGVFRLTAPEGTPTEATVKPPAPFSGTGTFKLESPTKASWTGDLSVEVPTLGKVQLAEPAFWAGACAIHCTETFPPGMQIGFGTASRLP